MDKKTKLNLFKTMYKIRQFEKAAYDLYTKNLIRGSIHLYIGEEAVATGICANLKKDDCITSTHRGHGHCIAKGGKLKPMMAELLGKKTGYCRGKGGSMHIADPEIGIFGANGIVGGGIGIATGLAFSSKYFNQKKVVICFFGDGAFNQGVLFEVINMSVAWKLPIIFVCENNYYALSTHFKDFSIDNSLTKKVRGFGIQAISVDGNDIEKVYNAAGKIIETARKRNAPGFIETMTYRWTGHFLGDREIYRTRKEVNEWKKRCPIRRYEDRLANEGFDIKELNQIKNKINLEVKEAVEFALESPQPEPGSIFEDIYSL
ncbi:MAG: thiamine pyrophosphate-dependent dehydrogenase E1 component subunit alpha [Actinobacteria bacterium]|nr:thiamine pyrophosphate-dependent dehydrogenase E1 component subunit alpha [Actinomycetota bacterium]